MTTDELFESSAHVIYLGDVEFRADNSTEFDELLESLFAFACDRVAVYAALMLATAGVYEELTATCDEESCVASSYLAAGVIRLHTKYGGIYDPENRYMKIHYSLTGG